MSYWLTAAAILFITTILLIRTYTIIPGRKTQANLEKHAKGYREKYRLAAFLGSGGHTNECLALLSGIDFTRYSPRIYIISEGDFLSVKKAEELESAKMPDNDNDRIYSFLTIPRARRVHQSLLATIPTALHSLLVSFYYLIYLPYKQSEAFSDVLILNGPGTCFTICVAALCSRLLGIPTPVLIYIESFARVKSLSLSGKLLRPLVDHFVVQWPQAIADGGRGECRGWLV